LAGNTSGQWYRYAFRRSFEFYLVWTRIPVAVISAFAHRSLFNNLKRHDPAQWVALGSPELFRLPTKRDFTGINSLRDGQRFFSYILSMKYRAAKNGKFESLVMLYLDASL
jgi:hypothetical protein